MLDHVFTDAIAALREALEAALLEPLSVEERFHADVLLGDLSWQTSYCLPGEGLPPRVQADILLEWSTWSQANYRSWRLGEPTSDRPRIAVEIVLRVQRLRHQPDPAQIQAILPDESSPMGKVRLARSGPRVEIAYDGGLEEPEHAIEFGFEGIYEFDEATLTDPAMLDEHFASIGGWATSTLVRLGDLDLEYLPPDEHDEDIT